MTVMTFDDIYDQLLSQPEPFEFLSIPSRF